MSIIQSIIFKKKYFNLIDVIKWIKKHDFKLYKIDEKLKTFRVRQYNPSYLKQKGYKKVRTKIINDGIDFIIFFK